MHEPPNTSVSPNLAMAAQESPLTRTADWQAAIIRASLALQTGDVLEAEQLGSRVEQALQNAASAEIVLTALQNVAEAQDPAWEDLIPSYLLPKLSRAAAERPAQALAVYSQLLRRAAAECAPRELAITLLSDWADLSARCA